MNPKTSNNDKAGMALPLVFGLITLASTLGLSLWLSQRAGIQRMTHSQEMLQLSQVSQAGITEGFARIKAALKEGIPLRQLNVPAFELDIPLDRGSGHCDCVVHPIREGRFSLRAEGKLLNPNGKTPRGTPLILVAMVDILERLAADPGHPGRLHRQAHCTLKNLHREEADAE